LEIKTPIGQLPDWYLTRNQFPQGLKHKRIEIEPTRKRKIDRPQGGKATKIDSPIQEREHATHHSQIRAAIAPTLS